MGKSVGDNSYKHTVTLDFHEKVYIPIYQQ